MVSKLTLEDRVTYCRHAIENFAEAEEVAKTYFQGEGGLDDLEQDRMTSYAWRAIATLDPDKLLRETENGKYGAPFDDYKLFEMTALTYHTDIDYLAIAE